MLLLKVKSCPTCAWHFSMLETRWVCLDITLIKYGLQNLIILGVRINLVIFRKEIKEGFYNKFGLTTMPVPHN